MSKKPRFAKHLKKTTAQVRVAGPVALGQEKAPAEEARIVLNEMTKSGLVFFCSNPVAVGQEISIAVDQPRPFFTKGRILSCNEFQFNQTIVSQKHFKYRILIAFTAQGESERQEIDSYYELVQKEVSGLPQAA